MKGKLKAGIIAIAAVTVLALAGGAIAAATRARDDEKTQKPITGKALERAKAAALAGMVGGTVTGTEVDDEEGAYEVEVTRADGSQIDVHLDDGFNVIGQAGDNDQGEGDGRADKD